MGKDIEFSLSQTYKTFICKLCENEFLIFRVNRGAEFQESDKIMGPLIRRIYCPFCGEEN